jgi:hypothetical protein
VTLMAIKNKQPVTTDCTCLCMVDEVLQLGKTKLICRPAVLADTYSLIWGVMVLSLVMVLYFEDEEGWDRLPYSIDASN